MVLNVPAGIPAAGKISVTIIPESAVSDPAAITVAEATAEGAVNASCHLLSDGYERSSELALADRRRACEDTGYQVAGARTVTFEAMRFVYDPQNPDAPVSEVYAALTEGEVYYIVERLGISGKEELAAEQYYDAYHVRLDTKEKLPPGDEGELEFSAMFNNLASPTRDAQLAAA